MGSGSEEREAAIRHASPTLDLAGYKLKRGCRARPLTSTQVRLLAQLMRQPTSVHSSSAVRAAAGSGATSSEEALKVCISRLRRCLRQLECDAHFLHSVRGIGYIFDPAIAPLGD